MPAISARMRADLALVGFGNVGRRFATLLSEQRRRLLADHDLEPHIVGIATKRHGAIFDESGIDVPSALEDSAAGRKLSARAPAQEVTLAELIARLAARPSPLRVVVETTTLSIEGRGQPAISHVEAAIDAGCDVVTANKGPVAFAYARLRDRAKQAGVSFLFEGAAMDGVPIFNLVREALPALAILGFRGIVNSTTNHILTALEDGEEFAPALARMQAEGIAEADASLDVEGWDAAAKVAALANVLMDAGITPHDVDRTGIGPASAAAAREAKEQGRALRLVASAERDSTGAVRSAVRPVVLPAGDLLGQLRGTANALVLRTDLLGEIAIHQLGGDLTMTAYALLSDLVTLSRRAADSGD